MHQVVLHAVLLINLLFIFRSTSCINSNDGFYLDNGLSQTLIERSLSEIEKQEMEMEFLNLLGLPYRPKKTSKTTVKKSAPKFLLDIYKSLLYEEDEENRRIKRDADINLSYEEQIKIDKSDVIMTIESINHHVDSVRHERGKRLWFDVTELPVAEDIIGAELKIYQNQSLSKYKHYRNFIVVAYQLIQETETGENELEFMSQVETTSDFTGWIGLNVTKCLGNWAAFPDSNQGIYLSVQPTNKTHEIRPEDIGLITVKGDETSHPFMVAFLKSKTTAKPNKRSTREIKSRVRKSDISSLWNGRGKWLDIESKNPCRINTLFINFTELKWAEWIIAPEGYPGYFCHGECNFPLNAHMNASNHAIVQTLVHLTNPTKFPKSCCAPTKLTPISVLYFLDDQNVVLKKYKDMVVKTCGCR